LRLGDLNHAAKLRNRSLYY